MTGDIEQDMAPRTLKAEIAGSNPARATKSRHELGPRSGPGALFVGFVARLLLMVSVCVANSIRGQRRVKPASTAT